MARAGLRVLYLIDSLAMGGAELVLHETCRQLLRRQVEVRVAVLQTKAGNPLREAFEALGIAVPDLGITTLRQPSAYWKVRRAVAGAAPDVVHTHLEFANVLGTLAARRAGVPCVATLHTIESPAPGSRAWLRFVAQSLVLRRWCTRVIAVSERARTHYLAVGRLRPQTTITVYNGVDLRRFDQKPPETQRDVRRELKIPDAAPVIAVVAVQRPAKGLDRLIAAFPAIRRRHPEAILLLVGDGPERPALETLAAHLGLSRCVRFAGVRHDVPRLLTAAAVFVLPSLTEALPTALAEAMAAGVPVIGSAVGGIAEMIQDGVTGILVPPGDVDALAAAVADLLDQPARVAELVRAARRLVETRFDAAENVARLHREYLDVCGRRS